MLLHATPSSRDISVITVILLKCHTSDRGVRCTYVSERESALVLRKDSNCCVLTCCTSPQESDVKVEVEKKNKNRSKSMRSYFINYDQRVILRMSSAYVSQRALI